MHVDFKITTWERCHLPDDLSPEQIEEIQDKIKKGVITCYSDLEEECGVDTTEKLLEVDEYMTPGENDGQATIELHLENGQLTPTASNEDTEYDDQKRVVNASHYLCDNCDEDITILDQIKLIEAQAEIDRHEFIDNVDGVIVWEKLEWSLTCDNFLDMI